MKKVLNLFFILSLSLTLSCNENYSSELCEGTYDTSYFKPGKINKIVKTYIHNFNYQVVRQFDYNGKELYKGSTFREKWVGPVVVYDTNGILKTYKELDFDSKTFYIIKYENGKLIFEEGLALAPTLFDVSLDNAKNTYLFIYAEPIGYKNKISVKLNGHEINFTRLPEHHLGILELDTTNHLLRKIEIESILYHDDKKIDTKVLKSEI